MKTANKIMEQVNKEYMISGKRPKTLLVSPSVHKELIEESRSELKSIEQFNGMDVFEIDDEAIPDFQLKWEKWK